MTNLNLRCSVSTTRTIHAPPEPFKHVSLCVWCVLLTRHVLADPGHVESWEGQRRIAFFVNSMYMRQPEVISCCIFNVVKSIGIARMHRRKERVERGAQGQESFFCCTTPGGQLPYTRTSSDAEKTNSRPGAGV